MPSISCDLLDSTHTQGKAFELIELHSGGDDVLKEIAGQDATEPFSNVGHSDDAREILKELQIGKVKRMVSTTLKSAASHSSPLLCKGT